MKEFIRQTTGKSWEELSNGDAGKEDSTAEGIIAGPTRKPTREIENADFQLMQALTLAQQNFVVTDPSLPDNPIVFASQGFYKLTGYTPTEVIGRNCRFLQGPSTDPASVAVIRQAVDEGRDAAVCLVNYKKDGTPFWNQFFVAPLRGIDGNVVNYVGVQCEVSEDVAVRAIQLAEQTRGKRSGNSSTASATATTPTTKAASASQSSGASGSRAQTNAAPAARGKA